MTSRRVTFDYDPEPDLSWLEQWDAPAECHGNPNRYVTLYMIVEEQCEHCGSWKRVDSLCNIHFMDDDNYQTGTFTKDTLHMLDNAYQVQLAKEAIGIEDEAKQRP